MVITEVQWHEENQSSFKQARKKGVGLLGGKLTCTKIEATQNFSRHTELSDSDANGGGSVDVPTATVCCH